jgi:hypothetical protein
MRLCSYPDLKKIYGIPFTNKHLIDLEKRGRFPRRIKFSPAGRLFWDADAIDAHIKALANAGSGMTAEEYDRHLAAAEVAEHGHTLAADEAA